MDRVRSFFVRMVNLFRRSRLEADLQAQLDAHREMVEADMVSHGIDASDARLAARRTVGNEMLIQEFTRDEWVHPWIDDIIRDVRYALRTLVRTPVFGITVVLTLESFAAWSDRNELTLTGRGEPERLKTEAVSYEFFSVLRLKPLLGRDFTAEDDRPQARPTIVLSYALLAEKICSRPECGGQNRATGWHAGRNHRRHACRILFPFS